MSIGVCVCLPGFLRDLTQNCSYSKEKQSTFKRDLTTPPIHTQPPLLGDTLAVRLRSTQPQQPCKQNQLHKKRLLGVGSQLVSCVQLEDPNANIPIRNSSGTLPSPDSRR